MHSSTRFRAAAVAILLAVSAFISSPLAAQSVERRTPPSQPQVTAPIGVTSSMDAESTREALMEVLSKHPPAVGRIIKLDPTLMRNETYLASYPLLRDFLAQHPEVQQNASYYLAEVRGVSDNWEPRNDRVELMENILGGAAAFTVFVIVLGTMIWLTRTVLEQRRWNRLSKIQAEVHSKLMDRFSSNDELIAYVQTPSGRRFLESGPSPLQETMTPSMSAPLSRILWSVQAGAVLTVAGIGMLMVRGNVLDEDVRAVILTFGTLILALGVGFVVSAVAAYAISHKLGLLHRTPAQDHA